MMWRTLLLLMGMSCHHSTMSRLLKGLINLEAANRQDLSAATLSPRNLQNRGQRSQMNSKTHFHCVRKRPGDASRKNQKQPHHCLESL